MTKVILIIIIATTILKVLLIAREAANVSTVAIINCQRWFQKPCHIADGDLRNNT